jgi:hypothetical protein
MQASSKVMQFSVFLAGILGLPLQVQANIRAPRSVVFPASSALEAPRQSSDLVVSEESLSFSLAPYTEEIPFTDSKPGFASVRAIYTIEAERQGQYELSFVMPDATPATVALNDFEIPASSPTPLARPGEAHRKTWESRFQVSLAPGRNVITVNYRQPVSAYEWNVGYFRHPKWHSLIHYELWPLKEWRLAANFRLHVDISVEDDTGWFSRLFSGPRWKISACEQTGDEHSGGNCLVPISIETPEHQILQHYNSGPDFPDRLRIRISE